MSYFKYYFDTSDLKLSLGAEKLLNIFRDRYELSAKKGFTGKNGKVVFLIKLDEIASLLGKSKITAFRMVDELREKGLIFTQKRQSGILEFSLNTNFNIIKNDNMDIIKNDNSYTYKPNQQARLTKPNARAQAHMRERFLADEKVGDEILDPTGPEAKNSQSEVLKNSSLENSPSGTKVKNPSLENSQSPNAKKSSTQRVAKQKAFLSMDDKPEFISTECWQDFITYKKQRNERYTDIGKSKFLNNLAQIQANTNACEEALNKSIVNNWQGVFEPKQPRCQTRPVQITNTLMDWISDDEAIIAECQEAPALPSNNSKGA